MTSSKGAVLVGFAASMATNYRAYTAPGEAVASVNGGRKLTPLRQY